MVSPYKTLVEHDGNYQFLFGVYSFVKIFENLWNAHDDKSIPARIIKFIAYGFTLESTRLSIGGNRRNELSIIYDELFPDEKENKKYVKKVLFLEDPIVLDACTKWVEFQDESQLEYLFTLQHSYIQQQRAALSALKKSDGTNIDYDQKHKCIEHMRELKIWIKDAQSELMQNNTQMKAIYKDLNIDNSSKKINNKGIESFLKMHEEKEEEADVDNN